MDRNEPHNLTITSWDYIKDSFLPYDRLAVVIKTRQAVIQRIAAAEKISSKAYQAWIRFKNAHAGEIYISMNTLKPEALGRTKKDIAAVRHLYLDLDHGAVDSLGIICGDSRIPSPSYVLNTSEGKYQVIWKISECDPDRAENLQQSMAIEFNADRAATDVTRVLRIPGFYNHKYDPPFKVTAQQLSSNPRKIEDFNIPYLPKLQPISLCKASPPGRHSYRGSENALRPFGLYQARGFCFLQAGWSAAQSGCSAEGCSVPDAGSNEYSAAERRGGISCIQALGCELNQCRNRKPENHAEILGALERQHYR